MLNKLIPVNRPCFEGNEKKYLMQAIDSGWISSESPFVTKFENSFAEYFDMKYASAVSNGTVALELAVRALNLAPGDEVILPAFTIISCVLAVIRAGATPILVDVDPYTWNMDMDLVEDKISKNTKALLIVHTYGLPTDIEKVNFLRKKYNLRIIEDNAEGIGLNYLDSKCGSFGDISLVSLYANKHVSSGEGGLVFTNDQDIYKKINYWKNLCFTQDRRFFHTELGWNFRLTGLQAAVGLAQLEQIDKSIAWKKKIAAIYNDKLKSESNIQLPSARTKNSENIYWVYGVVLTKGSAEHRDEVTNNLRKEGVETRPFFWPIHLQPALNRLGMFLGENYPVSERLAQSGFYLPSGLGNTAEEINYSADALLRVLGVTNF